MVAGRTPTPQMETQLNSANAPPTPSTINNERRADAFVRARAPARALRVTQQHLETAFHRNSSMIISSSSYWSTRTCRLNRPHSRKPSRP